MATPPLRPRSIRTDSQTPTTPQLQHRSQANGISPKNTGTREGPLLTQRRRNVVHSIPCSECPNAYVGQTGRQFATCMKEHKSAVRRQDENSLMALPTGKAFGWTRASVVGNGSTKRTREYIEAWKTTSTCVNQCTASDPCYKACEHIGSARARSHKLSVTAPFPLHSFPC